MDSERLAHERNWSLNKVFPAAVGDVVPDTKTVSPEWSELQSLVCGATAAESGITTVSTQHQSTFSTAHLGSTRIVPQCGVAISTGGPRS